MLLTELPLALLEGAPRNLLFTGKGGVGKTSIACASAIQLARRGRRVLLVSTDPASNLDEVLGARLGTAPTRVSGVERLWAMNIDPHEAARVYRDRVVGPYRGVLPDAAVRSIEEQLSGACTVEIAAFDEFSKLLGDERATREFDHVVFDTAPTGHTLRLLALPSAWSGFLQGSAGASCLGPLSGLEANRALYAATSSALGSSAASLVVLVTTPEDAAIAEADRTRAELAELGIRHVRLVVNAVFAATDRTDPVAAAMERHARAALDALPPALAALPRETVPFLATRLVGLAAGGDETPESPAESATASTSIEALIDAIAQAGHGVVMTMGKGGVGKTTIASRIAIELASRGHAVTLTTTDPAAHVEAAAVERPAELRIERIDPDAETARYAAEVLATAGAGLDAAGRALLEEDLRSPCTAEIALFRAFAETLAKGVDGFVVIDTAPTGHTLLLLDAAETYHREVERRANGVPDAVRELLPRLRDPAFTHVIVVTLPEATPVHEAMQLERDLHRAGIEPAGWVVNRSVATLDVRDPALRERQLRERLFVGEVVAHAPRVVVLPWTEPSSPARRGGAVSEECAA